jgi:hypothetical protein
MIMAEGVKLAKDGSQFNTRVQPRDSANLDAITTTPKG